MTDTIKHRAEQIANRIKAEVLADIAAGVVPATAGTFSELHNHVDANLYGGAEDLLEEVGLDAACDLLNPATDIVDGWLRRGGARAK